MKKITIAIDGYSACGKSTLAKQLARHLHYTYLDSGAMYRAITLCFIRKNIDPADTQAVLNALKEISLEFIGNECGEVQMWLNGENVEEPIRKTAVADRVSEVAAIPEVRTFAVARQRAMGPEGGVVMDGRDVGTTVFPHAELKLFMTADINTRALRRFHEMQQKNDPVSLEEIKKNLAMRDYTDIHREVSPLQQAADAIVIDNTHLTEEEQLQIAIGLAMKIIRYH